MLIKPFFGDREFLFFRMGGPGLGNLLFPYCRAYLLAKAYHSEMIPPIWPTLKIGPILRMEKDQRFYYNIFRSSITKRLRLMKISSSYQQISEETLLREQKKISENTVVVVKGLKDYFKDLNGYNDELYQFLIATSTNNVKEKVDLFNGDQVIGIHVRLGDYDDAGKTDIDWYLEKIKQIRELEKFKYNKLILFSDGTDKELAEILDLPNTYRVEKPDALSDILRLAKCSLIIGSNSTFSAWSAFLGKKPFIRHSKFYLGKLFDVNEGIYEGDLPPTALNRLN